MSMQPSQLRPRIKTKVFFERFASIDKDRCGNLIISTAQPQRMHRGLKIQNTHKQSKNYLPKKLIFQIVGLGDKKGF